MKLSALTALICAAALSLSACGSAATEALPAESGPDVSPPTTVSRTAATTEQVVEIEEPPVPTDPGTSQVDLSYPRTFAITRPTEKISTTYSSWFITGTSDPSQPVYLGSTEIQRQGATGLFGVHVNLSMGENSFSFRQGDSQKTVVITRVTETISPITTITQSSMYPTHYGSATAGGTLLAECTAPSGATVTASFGGQSVTLNQITQTSASGIPATFRGNIPVGSSYSAGETTNAGKITYTMTYGGSTKSLESSGDVYIAGDGARIAIEVDRYLGILYTDTASASNFRELLKEGATDYVESQDNSHYKLASGGYLPTSMARILDGSSTAVSSDVKNTLSSVSLSAASKSETYTFSGSATPVFYTKTGDSSFSITFFNTSGTPPVNAGSSALFSSVTSTDHGNSVSYTFNMKRSGNLWGYNVSFDGNNTLLRFAYKPSLSGGSTPLSGVTVVLDPGHGKDDSGALGIPGKSGPDENAINLAHALATKSVLESQGARVLMTRTSLDGFLELDERLEFFENSGADFFISIHHNSLAESADANTVNGMEVYYHTVGSQNLANHMMNGLTNGLGRRNRFVSQSYYRVTLLPYAPSILCELGYLCNPLEYETVTTQSQVNLAAQALADGVKRALS